MRFYTFYGFHVDLNSTDEYIYSTYMRIGATVRPTGRVCEHDDFGS